MNYKERISKKRSRIENKIIETYKIFPYSIDVSTREESGTGIEEFKTLFNANDPDCRIALWNAIPRYTNIDEVEKDKFSDDEYQFILQKVGSRENYTYEFTNCNNAIYTDRLVLKSAEDPKMLKTYQKHLKEDGDFILYTGFKLTREHLSWFHLSRPYCFAVCEKNSDRMVGMVGLHHYDEERHMAQMEWYIFKPYRSMGYGKEAVTALAKRAFGKKLFEWREKVMKDTYKKHYAVIDLLRVDIKASNLASQNLAKSCGFKVSHIDRRHFVVEGKGLEDAVIMELEPNDC